MGVNYSYDNNLSSIQGWSILLRDLSRDFLRKMRCWTRRYRIAGLEVYFPSEFGIALDLSREQC